MRISFNGKLVEEKEIRAGFIGCGSHSFRNLYPTFQFASVNLVATCDIDKSKAEAFAAKFGANAAYDNHREMLEKEDLDAVFICTGYDENGRPQFPKLAIECLEAGVHVWTEKPPAASCGEIEMMQAASEKAGKNVVIGMKKMFFPANEKAKELMDADDFGAPQMALLQYPQNIPWQEQFDNYRAGQSERSVRNFLDHLCHPTSLMVYLLGMPESLYFQRSPKGAGVATFSYASGVVASIAFTHGSSNNGGMERTTIVSDQGRHITVENNHRVTLHKSAPTGYGNQPSFYQGSPDTASAVWEPEFSLGQLYNKGLFLLGYYGEINEFARSVLEQRKPVKGTLQQAGQVTRIFEAFAEGPGKRITF
ncbi:MAG: Gfo/Idh/MocA family protein [Candidatus Sumerlaeota bacterium]